MKEKNVTTIRLTEEDRNNLAIIEQVLGVKTYSKCIRFALRIVANLFRT